MGLGSSGSQDGRLSLRWYFWIQVEEDGGVEGGMSKELTIVAALLCALYWVLSVVVLVQLLRIRSRAPHIGWTLQKLFLLLTLCMALLRGVFFLIVHFFDDNFISSTAHYPVVAIFADLPSLLYFSTYTLLILFYAEIILQASRQNPVYSARLRVAFIIINVIVYLCQLVIWMLVPTLGAKDEDFRMVLATIDGAFYAAVASLAAIGFLIFGTRLFRMLRSYPAESPTRRRKLREVGWVTSVCTLCFSARAVMTFLSVMPMSEEDFEYSWVYIFAYYFGTELFPTLLVVFILRMLPPRAEEAAAEKLKPDHVPRYGSVTPLVNEIERDDDEDEDSQPVLSDPSLNSSQAIDIRR